MQVWLVQLAVAFLAVHSAAQMMPICNVLTAADELNTSPLLAQGLSEIPPGTFTMTSNTETYTAGQPITLTMTGPSFQGFLMYANPSTDTNQRVGTFTIPTGMQNNHGPCSTDGLTSESPNSSIISSNTGTAYPGTQTIVWTAPMQSVGQVHMNVMILMQVGTGWGYSIIPCIIVIRCAGAISAPIMVAPPPLVCPPPITVIQKEMVTVTQKVAVTQTVTQTVIQKQVVTVTQQIKVTETVQVIQIQKELQIRKCQRRPVPTIVVVQQPTRPVATQVVQAATQVVIQQPVAQPTQCCLGEPPIVIGGSGNTPPIYSAPPPVVIPQPTPCCLGETKLPTPIQTAPPAITPALPPSPSQPPTTTPIGGTKSVAVPTPPTATTPPSIPPTSPKTPPNPAAPLPINSPILPAPAPAATPSTPANQNSKSMDTASMPAPAAAAGAGPNNVPGVYQGQAIPGNATSPNQVPSVFGL
ncbi:hypothetical protein HDU98_006371 [Podochytrium sp. JEL0797]|nr:hypothetical protein HDU98_006371 [Podochytrium sp. JEL0797]